jgi:metallophosphoesterase superfamily enzyme
MKTQVKLKQILSKEEIESILVQGDIKEAAEACETTPTNVNAIINLYNNSPKAFKVIETLIENAIVKNEQRYMNALALKQKLNHYKASA